MIASNSTIGARLRFLRESRGISLKAAGAHVGVSATAIHKYESGVNEPSLEKLQLLADLYGTTPQRLIKPKAGRAAI